MLIAAPTIAEVYKVVFSMENNKSPDPDGMSTIFYKKYWHIVGRDIFAAMENFFKHSSLSRAFNHTFITLIPKRATANRVDHYRPIALCNVAYKVNTKLLSTRLKSCLEGIIHPNQSVFIPNRSIADNCILNQEVMAYLNTKKGRHGFMAVKVDLAKAYDKVEWGCSWCYIGFPRF